MIISENEARLSYACEQTMRKPILTIFGPYTDHCRYEAFLRTGDRPIQFLLSTVSSMAISYFKTVYCPYRLDFQSNWLSRSSYIPCMSAGSGIFARLGV